MANTINDLYTKYTNKVERTLENDRYFQYLFEIVQAGNNTIRQNNRVLHKVVDEQFQTDTGNTYHFPEFVLLYSYILYINH